MIMLFQQILITITRLPMPAMQKKTSNSPNLKKPQ
jgi:hypothetical protein